ncbi:hypothetical protein H0H87_008301 [Tephrocybe sp. NHM501043]|nr:hypothetical protein H0H87_008301 [Tephrocybe sp. NHM501043]
MTSFSDVKGDIASFSKAITDAHTALAAFSATPGVGTLPQALAIREAGKDLLPVYKKTAADCLALSPSPVSEAEGNVILSILKEVDPIVIATADKTIERKEALAPFLANPNQSDDPAAATKKVLGLLKEAFGACGNSVCGTMPVSPPRYNSTVDDDTDVPALQASLAAESNQLWEKWYAKMDTIIDAFVS